MLLWVKVQHVREVVQPEGAALPPNQLLELTAYQPLCLHFGAAHRQTRAWLNGRSSTRYCAEILLIIRIENS